MKKRPTPSPVPAVQQIAIEKITVPGTRHRTQRPFDELQRSIAAVGLLNPIVVTADKTLVAGLHRLRACAALGWKEIPATVVPLSAIDAELAEIDENLCRTELTVLERGEHLARRKALYVARHPETKVGGKGGGRGGVGTRGTENESISFSVDTAGQLGESARNIEMEVQIAEGLSPEVRDALRTTPIANRKIDLLSLVRLDEAERQPIVALLASGAATTVAEARKQLAAEPAAEEAPAFDKLGHRIDDPGIAEAFKVINERTAVVLHHLRAAKLAWGNFHDEQVAAGRVNIYGGSRAWAYPRLREVLERELKFMIYVVKSDSPWGLCPYCGGAPWTEDAKSQCKGCGGVGWGGRDIYQDVPPELLAALDARGIEAPAGSTEDEPDDLPELDLTPGKRLSVVEEEALKRLGKHPGHYDPAVAYREQRDARPSGETASETHDG